MPTSASRQHTHQTTQRTQQSRLSEQSTSVVDNDPFLKNQLNLMVGQEKRMNQLFRRVERSQLQTR